MITYLKGTLVEKMPTRLVVEVGGVGYEMAIPLSSFEAFGAPGESIEVLTHLHVRDDGVQLFGFATTEERELFLHLLSVAGVGPKLAQAILSGSSGEQLRRHITHGDVDALAAIRGVGKKTAQRLVVDLREKLGGEEMRHVPWPVGATKIDTGIVEEALLALISLGYPRATAQSVLEKTLTREVDAGEKLSVEELLKRALRNV